MSTTDLLAPTRPAVLERLDARVSVVLESPRASLAVAGIVFVATLVQVLTNPIVALIDGIAEWPFPLPMAAVVAVLVLGCAVQALFLLASARWPIAAVLGTLITYLLLVVVLAVPNWLSAMQLVVAVSLFLLATRRSIAASVVWFAAATAICIVTLSLWAASLGTPTGAMVGFVTAQAASFVAPAAGATALGAWWGVQSRRVRRAQLDAEAATRDHEERLEDARNIERARIAQELHDVAGQHLTGLITLADAAVAFGPDRAEDVVQLVEDVRAEGRFAAASLYGALADLRAFGGEQVETTRDLRRASDLVAYWRQRGMTVDLQVTGDLDDLPAVVSTTAYRGVQEALTNASKHAPGAPVEVEITLDGEWLRVTVENAKGRERAPEAEPLGLGWGLDGIRDRLVLIDGSMTAAPTPDEGWRVRMRIPMTDPSATA